MELAPFIGRCGRASWTCASGYSRQVHVRGTRARVCLVSCVCVCVYLCVRASAPLRIISKKETRHSGADVHSLNRYGCNAAQWAAQRGDVPMYVPLYSSAVDVL
jgi:hypothetical protein